MTKGIIFLTILLSILLISMQKEVAGNSNDDYEDDYYYDPEAEGDSKEIEDTTAGSTKGLKELQTVDSKGTNTTEAKFDREELTTKSPLSKYEVTETVIDVPDVNTKRIPIITNFTITKPLNLAGVPNNKTNNLGVNVQDEGDEVINSIFVPDKPKISINNQDKSVKDKKDIFDENKDETEHLDNFEIKDSFHDEFDKEFDNDDDDDFDFKEAPKPKKGLKNYLDSLNKNIFKKISHVVEDELSTFRDLRHMIQSGIPFLGKLHRKGSDLAKKLDNAVKRLRYYDTHDVVGFHDIGFHDDRGYDHDFK